MGAAASADYGRPENHVRFQEYPVYPEYGNAEESEDDEGSREDTRTSLGQQIQNRAHTINSPKLAALIRISRREKRLAVDLVKKEEYDAWKLKKIRKVIRKKITAKSHYAAFFSERPTRPPPAAEFADDGDLPRRLKPVVSRPVMSSDLWPEDDQRAYSPSDDASTRLNTAFYFPEVGRRSQADGANSGSPRPDYDDDPAPDGDWPQNGGWRATRRPEDDGSEWNGRSSGPLTDGGRFVEANLADGRPEYVVSGRSGTGSVVGVATKRDQPNGAPSDDWSEHDIASLPNDTARDQERATADIQQSSERDDGPKENVDGRSSKPNNGTSMRRTPSDVSGEMPREKRSRQRKAPITSYNTYRDSMTDGQHQTPRIIIRNPITGLREEINVRRGKKRVGNRKRSPSPRRAMEEKKNAPVEKGRDGVRDNTQRCQQTDGVQTTDEPSSTTVNATGSPVPAATSRDIVALSSPERRSPPPRQRHEDPDEHVTDPEQTAAPLAVVPERVPSGVSSRQTTLINVPPRYARQLGGISASDGGQEIDPPQGNAQPRVEAVSSARAQSGNELPKRSEPRLVAESETLKPRLYQKEYTLQEDSASGLRSSYPEANGLSTESDSKPGYGTDHSRTNDRKPSLGSDLPQLRHRTTSVPDKMPWHGQQPANEPASGDVPSLRTVRRSSEDPDILHRRLRPRVPDPRRAGHHPANKPRTNTDPGVPRPRQNVGGATRIPAPEAKSKPKEDDTVQNKENVYQNGVTETDQQHGITPVDVDHTPRRFTVFDPKSSPRHKPPPRRSFLALNQDPDGEPTTNRTPPKVVRISPRPAKRSNKVRKPTPLLVKEADPPVINGKRFERTLPVRTVS